VLRALAGARAFTGLTGAAATRTALLAVPGLAVPLLDRLCRSRDAAPSHRDAAEVAIFLLAALAYFAANLWSFDARTLESFTSGVPAPALFPRALAAALTALLPAAALAAGLLRRDRMWLWIGALAFHYSFLVVFVRHLRFFIEPVPYVAVLLQRMDGFFQVGVPPVMASNLFLLAALTFLFARRLWSPQLRYLSLASDYFPLFLLIGIAGTGVLLRHFVRTDIVNVKELAMGLVSFKPAIPKGVHWFFFLHLTLVATLFAYFPFSKLMHVGGVFLSPTRNLANNNRMVRHVNPWNAPVEVHTYAEYEDDFRDKMKAAGLPVEKE